MTTPQSSERVPDPAEPIFVLLTHGDQPARPLTDSERPRLLAANPGAHCIVVHERDRDSDVR